MLDEADRMLDMGFIDDINTIAGPRSGRAPDGDVTARPSSATSAASRRTLLARPAAHRRRVASPTRTRTSSSACTGPTTRTHKNALLDHILTERARDGAGARLHEHAARRRLARRRLAGASATPVASLHGGACRKTAATACCRACARASCGAGRDRRRAHAASTCRRSATSINYGLPMKAEDYVHRIGRTGRAGRNGLAVTLAERDRRGHDPPHPAVHDTKPVPDRDDRRARAEGKQPRR